MFLYSSVLVRFIFSLISILSLNFCRMCVNGTKSTADAMFRDLINLNLESFVSLTCNILQLPPESEDESVYLASLKGSVQTANLLNHTKVASKIGHNILFTTNQTLFIIQITANKTAEDAMDLIDQYKSTYFNQGKDVLCLGIDYKYVGSTRISLQDRLVNSWMANLYSEDGTLKKSYPPQQEVYKRYAIYTTNFEDNFQPLQRRSVEVHYDILEIIDKSDKSAVYMCCEKKTGDRYAAKFKYITWPAHVTRERILDEVDIMRQLNHTNLLLMREVFEEEEEIVMIVDLMSGGTLFDRRRAMGKDVICEHKVAGIMKQIAEGVKYMHENNFVHFDIHPGNVMCVTEECKEVKLIDFSKAGRLDTITVDFEEGYLKKYNYSAPEVLEGKRIGYFTDMWSLGLVAYYLVAGEYPYPTKHDTEMPKQMDESKLFTENSFSNFSEIGKDFIRRLLIEDRDKRMTIHECLGHKWIHASNTN